MLCPSCGRENPSDAQFCNECEGNLDIPVAKTAIPPKKTAEESSILTSGTFVGRHREIAALQAALADALAGQGRMMMLVGEPGIGKTRTAQELAGYAETLGVQLLWGRCYEEQDTPPYWLWVQPIRSYALLQRNESGDRDQAIPLLEESLAACPSNAGQ